MQTYVMSSGELEASFSVGDTDPFQGFDMCGSMGIGPIFQTVAVDFIKNVVSVTTALTPALFKSNFGAGRIIDLRITPRDGSTSYKIAKLQLDDKGLRIHRLFSTAAREVIQVRLYAPFTLVEE